jgi:hypothetical protein
MKDKLSTASFYIEEQFVPRLGNRMLSCHFLGCENHLPDYASILFGQIVDAPDVSSGYDKQVDRGMGMDVLENHDRRPLMDEISRCFSPYDPTEDAVLLHRRTSFRIVGAVSGS